MTNYEKIKSMSVEEMAEFIHDVGRESCEEYCKDVNCDMCDITCNEGIKQWLEAEAD